MRICFVVNELSFFLTHRLNLAKLFSKNYEVIVITDISNSSSKEISSTKDLGIRIRGIKKRKGPCNSKDYFRYLLNLRTEIKDINPEYVFFVTLELSMIGSIVAQACKINKSFFIISGLGPFFLRKGIKSIMVRLIYRTVFFFLRMSKTRYKFIFQNQENKSLLNDLSLSSPLHSLLIEGNGIDLENFGYLERSPTKEVNFLLVSRLVKSKGIREFIKASKELHLKYPNTRYKVAGYYDPNDPDSISVADFNEIEKGPINYLGHLNKEQILATYNGASVFVLPSYGEGLPQAAIEAASTGMPLILSDVSGCRSCVEDGKNGYLINLDGDHLYKKMETFIIYPEFIKEMGLESRKMVEARFSNLVIGQKYTDLLN